MSTGFSAVFLHIELGLNILIYFLRLSAVVSDCTGAQVVNDTRRARHNQSTNGHRIYSMRNGIIVHILT